MTTLRTVLFVAVSSLSFACGAPDAPGGIQTCTSNHACSNGACTCNGGAKAGQSCCDPNDSSCSTAQQCPAFCRTCM